MLPGNLCGVAAEVPSSTDREDSRESSHCEFVVVTTRPECHRADSEAMVWVEVFSGSDTPVEEVSCNLHEECVEMNEFVLSHTLHICAYQP
jgi:hypothetical protein